MNLPLFVICESCRKTLENSVKFRTSCLAQDMVFRQLFSIPEDIVKDDVPAHTVHPQDELLNFEGVSRMKTEKTLTRYNLCRANDPALVERTITGSHNMHTKQYSQDEIEQETTNEDFTADQNHSESFTDTKQNAKQQRRKILCVTCGKLVSNIYLHDNEQHSKEKIYDCPQCPMKMTNRTNMRRHIATVHEKKITKTCDLCGGGFVHLSTFSSHMMSAHGIGKTYECKLCEKTFKQPAAYNKHVNRCHTPAIEYTCKICNMVFHRKKRLNIHQRVHSKEQPYGCNICFKRFKSSYAKQTHELTHTGIRFSCELCDKSYRYKSQLSLHNRKHHDAVFPHR
ncbi:zinc finger protein 25-like [Anopheles coustani]|nr:zinc finger protein 25-like [Anopheles coustani]